MPLELIVRSPKEIGFVEYQDSEPALSEVLVQTIVSGIKHGTEINMYRGTLPFASELWDPELRLFRSPGEGESVAPFYPHTLGSWAAGVVLKVGPDVRTFQPGDLVHGEWKHRQTALKTEAALYRIPEKVDEETMVFTDPARFALAAIHDAEIKLGDRVAIFGMGAIGMLALQMARLDGAAQVIAVDPIPERLELAHQLGADLTINPEEKDAGISIKQATGGRGVDVALEISGAYASLQQAIRGVHQEGLVVTASYYGDRTTPLDFSREWHHNRITLRSSMPVWDCSHRNHPMWDLVRLERAAVSLLEEQKLNVKPLIGARIPFDSAAEAYSLIDQSVGDKIKIILTYCS
jgi:2-desacetyl-2-hydroxyethyl bacteriochlorophyllide A dehydrogenase